MRKDDPPPTPPWLVERADEHGHPEWIDRCPRYDDLFQYLLDELAKLKPEGER